MRNVQTWGEHSKLENKWAKRWLWVAIIQGILAVGWTAIIVLPSSITGLLPEPARIIASGSAGTWFFVGYITYIVVGVLATGVTGLLSPPRNSSKKTFYKT